ncbi:MAG: response regulator [Bacteroidales bacterium]|nr:response regulator [Bacteroidales bacterium]
MSLKTKLKYAITIIAVLSIPAAAFPKSTHDSRMSDHVSLQDITDFAQDRYGNMWIASLGGLNRYNGDEYEHFAADANDSTSLIDDFVFSILYDERESALYVGIRMGLCRYEERDNTFTRLGPTGSFSIYDILADSKDRMWLSTHSSPVVYEKKKNSYTRLQGIGSVNTMWEDEAGRIWAGTNEEEGLAVLKGRDLWEKFQLPEKRHVLSKYEAADKRWWLGTNDGVVIFDPSSRSFADIAELKALNRAIGRSDINFICECDPLTLLIGTATRGVFCYDMVGGRITHDNPSRYNQPGSSQIQCCSRDDRGNIWIGTYDKGFFVANKQSDYFCQDDVLNKALRDKFVTRTIPGLDGEMWISTRYDGIFRYASDGSLTEFDSKTLLGGDNEFLETIMVDRNGLIWAAFDTQLVVARQSGSGLSVVETIHLPNVRVLKEDQSGNVWAGSWWGLYKFPADSFEAVEILREGIPEMIWMDDGSTIISKYSIGLCRMDRDGNISDFPVPEEIASHSKTAITMLADREGNLWLGTYNNGLACLRNDGSTLVLTKEDGLPSNNVLAIVEDLQGDIWASTHSGIIHLVENGKGYFVFNYNLRDVFPGEQYHEKSGGISSDGTIFFGGNHGITYFSPSEIPQSRYSPRINIEDLKIFNQSVTPDDGTGVLEDCIARTGAIMLKHNQRTITIDYAGIDYFSSNSLTYNYILEGFEKERNYVGTHRRATYSNLPPGRYVFKVWSVNYRGIECEEPAELSITVKRAPWLSIPAVIAYTLLFLGLVWFLLDTWIKLRLNRKRAELEHNEKERELEVSRMKTLFFSNISHELRTPLSLIAAPAQQLLASGNISGEERHLVEVINRNSSRMTKLMSQLMDFARMENGVLKLSVQYQDLISLLKEQNDSFGPWCDKKGIRLVFNPHAAAVHMFADTDKIEKIMNNLLSNAVKHTPEKGRIEIRTSEIDTAQASAKYGNVEGRFVEVSVIDSGEGMNPENLDQLFVRYPKLEGKLAGYNGNGIGLNYTKNIVERHKGRITARLRDEGGMEFSFIIPLEDVYSEEEKTSTSERPLGETAIIPSNYVPATGKAPEDAPAILIAEDNPDLREFLVNLVSPEYNVIALENGKLAWEQIQKKNPSIVLSDVMMPEMDGNELCSRIKEDERLCHIPVVLLTARTAIDQKIEGLENGADAYIGKPFRIDELMLTIRNLLHTRDVIHDYFHSPEPEEDLSGLSINSKDKKFLETLTGLMERELSNSELNIEDLTVAMGFSRTALFVKIKGLTGMSPNEFIRSYRFKVAARMIDEGETSLTDISDMCGFASYSYFSKAFKKHFGVNPKDYRKKN